MIPVRNGARARLVVSVGMVGLFIGALTAADPRYETWFVVALSALLVMFPFFIGLMSGRFDIFEPVYLFAAAFGVVFVVRPLFDLTSPGGIPPLVGYDPSATYTQAQVVGLLGLLGFLVGYYLPFGRGIAASLLPQPTRELRQKRLNVFVLLTIAASAGAYAIFLVTNGGLSFLSSVLSGRNSAVSAALLDSSGYLYTAPLWTSGLGILILAHTDHWASRRGIFAFAVIGFSQAAVLVAGDRSWVLPVLAAVIAVRYLRRQRRPSVVAIVGIVATVFFLGVIVPREYRNTSDRNASLWTTVAQTVSQPVESSRQFFSGADTAMVDNLAIELQFVPSQLHFQSGLTYLEALTRPIPRAIWPNKPRGDPLMPTIWPSLAAQHVGFAFSMFGEIYLDFGILGVFLVMCIFGIAWQALYAWYRRNPGSAVAAALFASCWAFVFVYLRGGIAVDYQRQLIVLVPMLIALVMTRAKRETLLTEDRRWRNEGEGTSAMAVSGNPLAIEART